MMKKRISVVLVLVLLLTSVSVTIAYGAKPPENQSVVSGYQEMQANPQLSDADKIKSVIDVYFRSRYEGQKRLEPQDFDFLLSDRTQKWVQEEKDKRESFTWQNDRWMARLGRCCSASSILAAVLPAARIED